MPKCILCENSKFSKLIKKVRDSEEFNIIQCKNCKNIQINPIPTINDNKKFYDQNLQIRNIKMNYNIKELRKKSENDTKRRVEFFLKNIKKNKKILEIGSGNGFFLEELKKEKYDISGCEISKERLIHLKKLKNITTYNFDFNFKILELGKKFDVVVMFHVLEHISNPKEFLENVRGVLKDKGKIVIEVPNSDDHQLALNESYNQWYWQRAHVNYYHPKTLSQILNKTKFKKIKMFGIQRYSIENMFHWKLKNSPQKENPSFSLTKPHEWIDILYKAKIEKNMVSDTIIAIATK